jgi:predicted AlkP superfamily pyrophosphatase or phosphodiesterase
MTGPGHAVILSGTYGYQNGIFANNWFDLATKKDIYCVADNSVSLVGVQGEGRSPANFTGSTFGDELRIQSGFTSRVVSVSNKDRAAILLGGKLANGTYWMVDSSFTTSTYYASSLPEWVRNFNASGLINSYFGLTWDRVLSEDEYAGLDRDDAPYEGTGSGLGRTFPHPVTGTDRTAITASYYAALLTSPYGSEILSAFAKEAVRAEKLGQREVTDLLCVGFSSNDYVGHTFGPNSHEVMDMTIRTDRILADFFRFLDREVGLDHCLIVLTSDHGVAPIPEYILEHSPHTAAGRVMSAPFTAYCNSALARAFGSLKKGEWLDAITNNNLYINREALKERKAPLEIVARALADTLSRRIEMAAVYTRNEMLSMAPVSALQHRMRRSYHPLRSGDVFYALKPYYLEGYGTTGTSHGEPYEYDAHVPVIFAGKGIRQGTFAIPASPADIGPTLARLVGVEFPAGSEGRVLTEAIDR